MVAQQQQQSNNSTPMEDTTGTTFGGSNPEFHIEPTNGNNNGQYNLEEDTPSSNYNVGETYNLEGQTGVIPPKVGAIADQRIAKIQFAYGQDAPDPNVMRNMLSTGREDQIRQQMSDLENSKDTDAKISAIKSVTNGSIPSNPDNIRMVQNLIKHKPDNDPNIVLEKAFARAYTNMLPNIGDPSTNPINESMKKNPSHTNMIMDISEELTTKQEIAKKHNEVAEAAVAGQSWSETIHDFVNPFMPGYNWYVTYNAVKGDYTKGILQGDNWAQQIDYLYSLPAKEMDKTLGDAIAEISKYNKQTAKEFAQAVINFSSTDQFIQNTGNIVDIASVVPVGGTLKILNKGISAITKGGAIKTTEEVATQMAKDAVRANASETTSIADTLAKMGSLSDSAAINSVKEVDRILGKEQLVKPLVPEDIQRTLPSVFNPRAIQADGANLSTLQTQRVIQNMEVNVNKVLDRLSNLGNVVSPDEAKLQATRETIKSLENEFSHVNKSVVDISYTPPELHPTIPNNNIGSVTARLGDRDGNPFTSQMQAYDFGRSMLGLHPNDIIVEQKGAGWYLNVNRNLDETSTSARQALVINSSNQAPVTIPNMLFGWARSANDRVAQHQIEQRIMAVSGSSALNEVIKPIAKNIGTLSKKETQRVGRVIEANRSFVDPSTGQLGRFNKTFPEFEKEFKDLHGIYPTEKETKAYFSAIQLSDIDYIMRNVQYHKELARMGMRETRLYDGAEKSNTFLSKQIDNLPFNDRAFNAGVLIHRGDNTSRFYRMSQLQTDEGRTLVKELQDVGYKILQPYNTDRKFLDGKYTNENVHFVLTKDPEVKNLRWDVLPYQEGFHKQYTQKYGVKQAQIETRTDNVTGNTLYHDYVGDRTVFLFNTKPEAIKYADRMEQARVLMKESPEKLKDFLSNNLPFSESKFRRLFEDYIDNNGNLVKARYSKDLPFLHTFDRQTTMDTHGDFLRSKYEGLQDQVRSPYNPIANVDKKFIGQKDADAWTVKESGTDFNPTYQLESARMIDPWVGINNAMSNIMRSRFMADYKTQAVESWVAQFGHLVDVPNKADLLNNSMYHVFQPQWKRTTPDNIMEMAAARNSRRAIMELIGNESPVQTAMGSIKQKLADLTYDKLGQRASDIVSDRLLYSEHDPIRAMKGFAFHTTIGMFNPLQLWQNLNTMSFAVGIGGMKGLYGSAISPLSRYAMINSNPKVLAELGSIAEKVTLGRYKSEWFQESFRELQKTGRMFVEGEHAWRDDLADPKFIEGALGSFLDKGQFFFREGERATRLAGWNTAFLEWRSANPEAKLTDQIRNKILARSDDMNANMTRASNSSLQQGILSVPLQFATYPMRITELMLRKSITPMEKARVIGINSALYGLPIGITGTTLGGFIDFYKDIREEGLRRNIPMSDGIIDALNSGIIGVSTSFITGRPNSIGDRAGPGGNSLFRDILSPDSDKTFIDLAFGASGSKLGSAITSTKPALGALLSYVTGNEQKVPLTINDFIDVARNVSSIDNGVKTFMALNTSKLITKNGTYQGDVTPVEAMIQAFTGGQPRAISDVELMKNWEKTRERTLNGVQKEATKWFSLALAAKANNDDPNFEIYMKRMYTLFEASDLRQDERAAMTKKIWETNQSQAEKVPMDFFIKKAPPSKAEGASKVYETYQPNLKNMGN